MHKLLVEFIFGRLAKHLDGYKMYILGVAAILKGIIGIIAIYWPDSSIPVMGDLELCLTEIWGGCIAIAGKSAIVKSTPCAQVDDGCGETLNGKQQMDGK